MPITVVILIALFSVQSRGTAKVATFFGPVTLIWFFAIAAAGVWHTARYPTVLLAFNPYYGISFLLHHGIIGFFTLGAVFLVVTGSEALYADLGHFGRGPIRFAWLVVVLPALTVNYLGQGALVLADPKAIENPFFLLFPSWALLPMVVLATAATVIASQAVITGAYSLTRQAIQLGLLPRLEIRHTSEALFGQIYMPRVNTLLLIGVLLLVALFRSSSSLASAYGIAVTGTMVVTAMMAIIVIWRVWRWPLIGALALMVPFLFIDLTFLAANMLKVVEGGWMPLALGALVMAVMYTWRRGSRLLFEKTRKQEMPLQSLVGKSGKKAAACRARHRRVFHQRSGICADRASAQPQALQGPARKERHPHHRSPPTRPACPTTIASASRRLSSLFSRVTLRFGFMETPNVPRALAIARKLGWQFDIMSTSFFLSRRSLKPAAHSGMPRWQDRLFIGLTRVANDATNYFQIPTGRVVEVGTQVDASKRAARPFRLKVEAGMITKLPRLIRGENGRMDHANQK